MRQHNIHFFLYHTKKGYVVLVLKEIKFQIRDIVMNRNAHFFGTTAQFSK